MTTTYADLSSTLDSYKIDRPSKPTEFTGFIDNKAAWIPPSFERAEIKDVPEGVRNAAYRALALALALELPVGEYAVQSSRREFTQDQKWALLDNSKDELTHFQALTNYVNALPDAQIVYDMIPLADQFRQAIEATREHPILMGGFTELGVFFTILAFLRKFGGTSMKLLVQSISRDESMHVRVNFGIIDEQKIPYEFSKLNKVRRDIIAWIFSGIRSDKYNLDFWMRSSDSLIATRQDVNLSYTAKAIMPAFFEIGNPNLPKY